MKRLWIFSLVFIMHVTAFAATGQVNDVIARSSHEPISSYALAHVETFTTQSGIKLFIVEDHSLPLIKARLLVPFGYGYVGTDEIEGAALMREMLHSGGTQRRSAKKVDDWLDDNAIDVEFSMDRELLQSTVSGLSAKSDEIMSGWIEMVMEPAFEKSRLSQAKSVLKQAVIRQMDNPTAVAERLFLPMIYGQSVWGQVVMASRVDRVSQKMMRSLHHRFFHPAGMMMAVAGDIDAKKMAELVDRLTASYVRSDPVLTPQPLTTTFVPSLQGVEKNINQTTIMVGHRGITRDNPDRYALAVIDEILTAPFIGRLAAEIRTRQGLAYQVGGNIGSGPQGVPGVVRFMARTASPNATQVTTLFQQILSDMTTGRRPITTTEFERARVSLLRSLVFQQETPFDAVAHMAEYVFFGLPEDFDRQYAVHLKKLTLRDLQSAAKTYLHPDQMAIIAVGKGVQEALSPFGAVTMVQPE